MGRFELFHIHHLVKFFHHLVKYVLSPHGETFHLTVKISNDNTFLHFITITLSFNPYATIGRGFNTPFSLFHSMEEEVCFFHFKVKKTCLCVNFSPTGEKLTFSGLFHLEVKKHTLGKIVKNHRRGGKGIPQGLGKIISEGQGP